MKRTVLFLLALLSLTACMDNIGPAIPYLPPATPATLDLPQGILPAEMDMPDDNPLTEEGIQLGRMLFYDPILSADSTQSCGSCHNQAYAFTDEGKQFSVGIDGIEGDMNSMAIINLGWREDFFWNGRSVGLEAQALEPVINPIEMHEDWPNVEMKLNRHPDYPALFRKAFGTSVINKSLVTKAIAQFERTLISGRSRYDLFEKLDPASQFTQEEREGYLIFFTEKGDCFHCHVRDLLTDNDYHNNGLDSVFTGSNVGRFDVTGDPNDIGKFHTPTLRNIALTAPYMHDGRFQTLEEVVEHYNSGVKNSPTVDPLMTKEGKELGLQPTDQEKANLVAFLKTFTDTSFINNPDFSNPFE